MVSKNVGSYDRLLRAFAGGGLAIAELGGYLGNIEQYFHYFMKPSMTDKLLLVELITILS